MTMIIEKMKKHQKAVLAFLLALVMLIGINPFTATEVHAVEVVATAEDTEAFTGDFTLVLVSQNDPTKTETHTVTYDGTSWNDPKSSILPAYAFAYTGEVNDIAYSDGNWSYTPVLQLDQSDPKKLANADVMIATGTATKDAKLDLNFSHYYAKVTFHINRASEFEDSDEIKNLYVVTKDSSTPEVTAYCSAANSDAGYHYDCSAYIPAGTYAVGDTFVKIDIGEYTGDKRLEAKISEENGLTLTAGTHYTFHLKVGKDVVSVNKVSTNDIGSPFGNGWNTEVNLDDSTGTIGTANDGKTAWANEDQIIITLTSKYYGTQIAAITYNGEYWGTDVSLSYLENETPTVSVIYAPCYEVTDAGVMQLRSGMRPGITEYISGNCEQIATGIMTITFEGAIRDYSRLRIVGLPNQTLTVTTTGFTPAGASAAADGTTYTVTTNGDGNAFLYGTFAEGATVSVKYGNVVLKDYTFTADKHPNGTEQGKSYALDARPIIDGTFGGKATASEEDVAALVEQLKYYVDNGITTITVTGSNPAMITITGDSYSYTITAIGEAIYRLSGSGTYSSDNPYNGKIDLILPDVTEIVDYEFQDAYALNSINLPKVTTVGDNAFYHCWYLQELTFGSVVTLIKDNLAFSEVGASVDGGLCDLVLNRGQASAAAEYQPNIGTNRWWNNFEWKSITLW